jgi:hypothetical protein
VSRAERCVTSRGPNWHLVSAPRAYDETDDGGAIVAQAADPAYDAAVREQVQLLLQHGRARFRDRLDAFLASALHGVQATEEAERRGVTASHVRKKERSEIRAFLAEYGREIGLVFAAAMVLLVVGSMAHWKRSLDVLPSGNEGVWAPRRHEALRPAADAASLRARAATSFHERDFRACLDDLDAARALDGLEDTVEEAEMRARAERAFRTDEPDGRKK